MPTPRRVPQPASPPRRDPVADARARRTVLLFVALVVATFVLDALLLPWRMLALGTGLAALVVAVLALRATWRAGLRGVATVALCLGALATGLTVLTLAVTPFVWRIELDRQDCQAAAITTTARRVCDQDYRNALQEWLTSLEQSLGR